MLNKSFCVYTNKLAYQNITIVGHTHWPAYDTFLIMSLSGQSIYDPNPLRPNYNPQNLISCSCWACGSCQILTPPPHLFPWSRLTLPLEPYYVPFEPWGMYFNFLISSHTDIMAKHHIYHVIPFLNNNNRGFVVIFSFHGKWGLILYLFGCISGMNGKEKREGREKLYFIFVCLNINNNKLLFTILSQ